MVEAYPLTWPMGWPRTARPERARFGDHSRAYAIGNVMDEVRKLGGTQVVVSTNLTLRLDGQARSVQKRPDDEGVAIYFSLNGQQRCFPCDRWDSIEHNLWAIAKSIEALRGLDRWGAKTMVEAAFRGFQALPPPDGSMTIGKVERVWYEVLGVSADAPQEVRKAAYRALAKAKHPDSGGSSSEWDELRRAAEKAGVL